MRSQGCRVVLPALPFPLCPRPLAKVLRRSRGLQTPCISASPSAYLGGPYLAGKLITWLPTPAAGAVCSGRWAILGWWGCGGIGGTGCGGVALTVCAV